MILGVDAVIIWTSRVEDTLAFYWSIGVPLQAEDHGDGGPVHYSSDVDDLHFAVFVATETTGDPGGDALTRGQAGASRCRGACASWSRIPTVGRCTQKPR